MITLLSKSLVKPSIQMFAKEELISKRLFVVIFDLIHYIVTIFSEDLTDRNYLPIFQIFLPILNTFLLFPLGFFKVKIEQPLFY